MMFNAKKSTIFTLFTLALSLTYSAAASASPSRSIAREHWGAIAAGNVSSVMADYQPGAAFHWKNGGLKGDYSGADSIRSVWAQFAKTRSPFTLAVRNIHETAIDKDHTVVTGEVTFTNAEWTYPLNCRLVLQDGKIAEETWRQADYDADPGMI